MRTTPDTIKEARENVTTVWREEMALIPIWYKTRATVACGLAFALGIVLGVLFGWSVWA